MSKRRHIKFFLGFVSETKHWVRLSMYSLFKVYDLLMARRFPLSDIYIIDIIRQLPQDAVCIDIGANEGQFLYFIVRRCRKGQILAYEPLPHLCAYLQKRFRKYVKVKNVALSDRKEVAAYYHFPKRNSLSGLSPRNITVQQNTPEETWRIETKCLDDDFTDDRLDFIKIDVEGAEMNVLIGARNTIVRLRPIIVFESGMGGLEFYGYRPEQLFSFFHEIGYVIHSPHLFLQNKKPFSEVEFVSFCENGYDCQFVASPHTVEQE